MLTRDISSIVFVIACTTAASRVEALDLCQNCRHAAPSSDSRRGLRRHRRERRSLSELGMIRSKPRRSNRPALSASTSRRHKPTNGRASKPHMPVIDTAVISTADDRPIYMPVDVDVPMDIDVVMDVDVAVYAADVAMDMRS